MVGILFHDTRNFTAGEAVYVALSISILMWLCAVAAMFASIAKKKIFVFIMIFI
jgi:hypothetical protein